MAELRIDGQLYSLYPYVTRSEMASGQGPNGEQVATKFKLVEPVTSLGAKATLPFLKNEKFNGLAALFGGAGKGSQVSLAHVGAGIGVEKYFSETDHSWSLAALLGYRTNIISDGNGTTAGPFLSAELCGKVNDHWALVGGIGLYMPGVNPDNREQFYSIGLRYIFGGNGGNGSNGANGK